MIYEFLISKDREEFGIALSFRAAAPMLGRVPPDIN